MTTAESFASGKGATGENFPVASALIAARHRGPILAFYRFARAADDVADHATLPAAQKLELLDGLEETLLGRSDRDPAALPLRRELAAHGLAATHALDLLTAFRRDVTQTRYRDWDDLIDYCRYSAMPVGRFVLDVHGESRATWPANDALCAALQVINHLQDCARDRRALDRVYLPLDCLAAHGAGVADLDAERSTPGLIACLRDLTQRTAALLPEAALLPRQVRDLRLALETGAIVGLAQRLVGLLRHGDPLQGGVHLGKGAALATAGWAALGVLLRRFGGPPAAAPAGRNARGDAR